MYKSPLASINSPATHLIPRCIPVVAKVGLGLAVEIMPDGSAEASASSVEESKEANMLGISAYEDGVVVTEKSGGVV